MAARKRHCTALLFGVLMSRLSLVRLATVVILVPLTVFAQEPAPPRDTMAELVRELQQQVAELRAAVGEIRAESDRYRSETDQLRRELQAVTGVTGPAPAAPAGAATTSATSERVARLQEQYDLPSCKIDEQYQTKVESDSRYRVKLSGIVLLNLFNNRGAVDNLDVPQAVRLFGPNITSGAFGGTIRQSEIGFEVFGPAIAGARTRANLQLDFAGGFGNAGDGATLGIETGTSKAQLSRARAKLRDSLADFAGEWVS
jgi:regulator of replication initiation timing